MEGDTAMSKISEETIKCPKCGKESKFVMWSSINTVLDPEMKKKVLTGEIFKFKCNKCGCEARINYSSLYHQMEDRIMIYYVQDEEEYESACNMFSGEDMPEIFEDLMAEKYLYRIVTSPGKLREKIIIFDNGLDDRVIEIAKIFYIGQAKEQGIKEKHIFFDVSSEGKYMFIIFDENGETKMASIEKELLEKIREEVLKDSPDIREDRFDIDENWALEKIMEGGK